jgi:predicted PurR-regulated permease PerM
MRGQLLIALVHGASIMVLLLALRVPLAVALGVLIFLGSFIPLVGLLARISAPVLRPLGQANSKRSWRPSHQGTVVSAGRLAWRRTGE